MKVVKIKNLSNKKEILKWLTELLLENENKESPLVQNKNLPNENFYVLQKSSENIENNEIIPAYISVKGDEVLVLWVSPTHRNQGYAKYLIKYFNIKYAIASPYSVPFWIKIGFIQISSTPIRMKYKK